MRVGQIVSLVTGILGSLLGAVALGVSIMTYLRDKPKLRVTLKWDMTENLRGTKVGLVRVANVGRRPVFLSIVALEIDPTTKHRHSHLILNDSIAGTKLSEGDKPAGFPVNYDQMAEYKDCWDKIRAKAEDSTGKSYFSDYPKEKPSWAN